MSYDKKEQEKKNDLKSRLTYHELENDDMNIKSHLNDSLDYDGISVSEDLINRTLEAIKQRGAEPDANKINFDDGNKTKKVIPFSRYIRGIAGVAAAVLVVTAGLNFFNEMKPKYDTNDLTSTSVQDSDVNESAQSKSSTKTEEKSEAASADSAANEKEQSAADTGTVSQYTMKADSKDTEDAKVGSTNKAGTAEEDNTSKVDVTTTADNSVELETSDFVEMSPTQGLEDSKLATSKSMTAGNPSDPGTPGDTDTNGDGSANDTGASDNTGSANEDTSDQGVYGFTGNSIYTPFRDIFLNGPEQAQYIKITDEVNKTEITLTTTEDILSFYSLMDQHQFTSREDACTTISYTIEVKSLQPEEYTYTMTIGDGITVVCATGEAVSQSIYNAEDGALLIKNIEEFYQKVSVNY